MANTLNMNLCGADLSGANFTGCELNPENLRDACLNGAKLDGAVFCLNGERIPANVETVQQMSVLFGFAAANVSAAPAITNFLVNGMDEALRHPDLQAAAQQLASSMGLLQTAQQTSLAESEAMDVAGRQQPPRASGIAELDAQQPTQIAYTGEHDQAVGNCISGDSAFLAEKRAQEQMQLA